MTTMWVLCQSFHLQNVFNVLCYYKVKQNIQECFALKKGIITLSLIILITHLNIKTAERCAGPFL